MRESNNKIFKKNIKKKISFVGNCFEDKIQSKKINKLHSFYTIYFVSESHINYISYFWTSIWVFFYYIHLVKKSGFYYAKKIFVIKIKNWCNSTKVEITFQIGINSTFSPNFLWRLLAIFSFFASFSFIYLNMFIFFSNHL